MLGLLAAAQTLRLSHAGGTNQALRDHAAIAVLLGCGLRVSELLNLNTEQYNGRGFVRVLSKGGRVRDFVPVKADARAVLDEWIAAPGKKAGALFITRTGERLTRSQFFKALQRVAEQASAHRKDGEKIEVSPHVLRHTFLRKHRREQRRALRQRG